MKDANARLDSVHVSFATGALPAIVASGEKTATLALDRTLPVLRLAADAARTFAYVGRIDAIGQAWRAPSESLQGDKLTNVGSAAQWLAPR